MPTKKSDDADYSVGYGKPPANSQFKPGHSGNPAGRPKGRLDFKKILQQALRTTVTVTENGRRRSRSKMEVAVTQVINKAAGGDLKALKLVLTLMPLLNPEGTSLAATPDLAADRELALRLAARLSGGPTKPSKESDD